MIKKFKYKFEDEIITLTNYGKFDVGVVYNGGFEEPDYIYEYHWQLEYKGMIIDFNLENDEIPTKEEIAEEIMKYFNHFAIKFVKEGKKIK